MLEAVWEARSMWYNIGLKLNISPGTLDSIKTENQNVMGSCFTDMLKNWLNNGAQQTWETLATALKSPMVGYGELAQKLVSN